MTISDAGAGALSGRRIAKKRPSAATDASGNMVMVWESGGQDNPDGKMGVYAQRYDPNGVAVGGEILVNTTTANDQKNAKVVMDPSGNFAVVWESQGQDNADGRSGIYTRLFDANGVALTGEILVNTTTADDQKEPAIAMDGSGNFVVVWESSDQDNADGRKGVYARLFNAAGVPQSGEIRHPYR